MRLAVEDVLEKAEVSYRLIELSDRAVSVEDVIRFSKGEINIDEITKTIIVKSKRGFTGLFLRGADKVSFKKLKIFVGKARIASREDVRDITGVGPGAVCPLLLSIPVIVDTKVIDLGKINFGSGNHLYGIEMSTGDLDKVLEFTVEDISE